MTVANKVAGLYITHDHAVIKDISDRVAVMLRGDLVEEGPVSAVLDQPQHEYTQMLMAAVPDVAGRKPRGDGAAESKQSVGDDDATHILGSTGAADRSSGDEDSASETTGTAASANAPLLEVRDVALSYGKAQILDGINLTLAPGECTMLLGESGS